MGNSDSDNKDNEVSGSTEPSAVSDAGSNQDNLNDSEANEAGGKISPASSGHKKSLSKGDIIRYIIMGIALCVFIFASVGIIRKLSDYKKARNIYDNAAKKVFVTKENTSGSPDESPADDESGIDPENGYHYLNIDFSELKDLSSEAVGWVDVPACGISYPIVQHSDNDYYINHTFDDTDGTGGFTWAGAIFLDYRNSADFSDSHFFIYGHHMYDNSMFANLLKYDDESYYRENEGNNVFYIYTEDCIKKYEIFCITDASSETQKPAYYFTDDSFTVQNYVDFITSIELYDTGISADGDDQIATLFTCQDGAKSPIRHLVHGKLVETIKNNT